MTATPYQLFPALDSATEAALRASIDRWGVLVPVAKDQDGNIIDGHHRARIAAELGVPFTTLVHQVDEDEARELAATLNMTRRHLERAQRLELVKHLLLDVDEYGIGRHSSTAIANAVGVGQSQVMADQDELISADKLDPEELPNSRRGLDGKVRPSKRPATVIAQGERQERKAQRALATLGDAAEGTTTTRGVVKAAKRHAAPKADGDRPTRPPVDNLEVVPEVFSVITIDPPWRYGNTATRAAAEDHYGTMNQEQLLALDVPAADVSHLYLWVTNSFLADGLALVEAWGFQYKTCLTWCKPQIGMGNYFRATTEHVLFGIRGRLPTLTNNTPTHFVADRQRHSQKPELFYDIVEANSPGPYLEMFARRRRFGWHVWGNEA